MRILVLDANYPHAQNLAGDVFVHVRVKRYIELGHHVRVVVFFSEMSDYVFDGVEVSCVPNLESLRELIRQANADVIAVHFFQGWMLKKILIPATAPVVVWVHGTEALMWYRRLFNFALTREFLDYVRFNLIQVQKVQAACVIRTHNAGPRKVCLRVALDEDGGRTRRTIANPERLNHSQPY